MLGIPIPDMWLLVMVSTVAVLVAMRRVFAAFSLAMGFAYPNGRFNAMGNEYITRAGVQKLKEARNLKEAVNVVSSRDYEFPPGAPDDVESAVEALSDIEDRFISMIHAEMPKKARPFFHAILYRDDLEELREAFIRRFVAPDITGVTSGGTARSGKEGDTDATTVEGLDGLLSGAGTSVEAAKLLSEKYPDRYSFLLPDGTVEDDPLRDSLTAMEENGDFSGFENLLDREYFKNLKKMSETITPFLRSPARALLSLQSDIFNVKTALRGAAVGLPAEAIRARYVPPGGDIAEWKLDIMAEAKGPGEVLEELKGTPLAPGTGEPGAAGGDEPSAVVLEAALDGVMLDRMVDIARRHSLTTGGTLRFFASKRFEIRNLNVIFRSLGEGIPREEYEGMLVMEAMT